MGAVAYAWFWNTNGTANAAGVKLGAITSYPGVTISAPATGTYLGNSAGLSVDNSFNTLDFDGLFTYTVKNGLWTDMNNGTFTPAGNGQVLEVESDLETLFVKYQAQPNAIWCSADVRQSLEQAIIFSQTGTNSFIFTYDKAGQAAGLTGGFVVTAYKSKYSIAPDGGDSIPIRIHPMFPQGTMLYDINVNPYPHARVPAVRAFLLQRDYYAIEWPVTTRQWTFGTYIHEVLAHYMPWITACRTGVGPFVSPCWLAAVAFDEDFYTGPKTSSVRGYLLNWERHSGLGKIVVGAYRLFGERTAKFVAKRPLLKKLNAGLFNRILAKAIA
jgi:hypothetical protein